MKHTELIDTYFRRQFRKLSVQDALAVIEKCSQTERGELESIEGVFWFWESLEEALHGRVHQLSQHDYEAVTKFFAVNFKGSHDFMEELMQRAIKNTPFPWPFTVSILAE